MDKSILEYASNNFVKKCPNCSIITEKQNGCNHITCAKCQYQWCWLCNEKYEIDHYDKGKCKGFQFFKPKNQYEIQLMMEGKINLDQLSESQRQFNDSSDFDSSESDTSNVVRLNIRPRNIDSIDSESYFSNETQQRRINRNINGPNIRIPPENPYNLIRTREKILISIIFIFLGNFLFIYRELKKYNIFIIIIYAPLIIPFFFVQFYINIISLVLILIILGFKEFILIINGGKELYFKNAILIFSNFFIGIFLEFYVKWKELVHNTYILPNNHFEKFITFFPCFIMLFVVFFPSILFYNFIYMIIIFVKEGSFYYFTYQLNSKFENAFFF